MRDGTAVAKSTPHQDQLNVNVISTVPEMFCFMIEVVSFLIIFVTNSIKFPKFRWFYRQFCMELNGLAVRLQGECQPDSCTQMTATEQWIFLCAAHKTPKECPAIDYTRHTLDGAACLLNSNKYFPSRSSKIELQTNISIILSIGQARFCQQVQKCRE